MKWKRKARLTAQATARTARLSLAFDGFHYVVVGGRFCEKWKNAAAGESARVARRHRARRAFNLFAEFALSVVWYRKGSAKLAEKVSLSH